MTPDHCTCAKGGWTRLPGEPEIWVCGTCRRPSKATLTRLLKSIL